MLILASSSPRRRELLEQAGIKINKFISPNIDETRFKSERPLVYVKRMALSKSKAVKNHATDYVLSADTIVMRGHKIFGKPDNVATAERYLSLLSGRRHRVITSVCLARNYKMVVRTVTTVVTMKRLSSIELRGYLECGEWQDKAGGYAIQGQAAKFIPSISGSYTNVVGLPLTETLNLLNGTGYMAENEV